MKKLCMITTISGTMKSFVVETAKYLHEQCGYNVTLICSEDEKFAFSLPANIRFIPVHMARGVDISAIRSISKFIKIFKKEQFDLIQYSTPNAGCYASIAARIIKAPVRLYCQWGIRYVGMNGFQRTVFKTIEKMICANSTHIRAVSPLNLAFAIEEGLYPSGKAKVIGHGGTIGVDMQHFELSRKQEWRTTVRSAYGVKENDFIFGFVGRIHVDKGCAELLAAFRSVYESNNNAKLMVIGDFDGNCGIASELLNWAKNSNSVMFVGRISIAEIPKYYAALDVLVHPTYREGFGMIIQEAGALAVPVITTRIPGASEVMEDGISCMLVEMKNEMQLADAMAELAANAQLTKQIGMAAYDRTKQLYNRPIMLENQRKDYEELIGG